MDGYYQKTNRDRDKIISTDAARIIAKELNDRQIREIRAGRTRVLDVNALIKGYFKSSRGQDIFRPHYKNVVDQLAKFINNFGLKIIEQGQDTFIESQKIIANDLLSPYDAQHYACYLHGPLDENGQRRGTLDYLFTMDGDFERVASNGTIIKIAS